MSEAGKCPRALTAQYLKYTGEAKPVWLVRAAEEGMKATIPLMSKHGRVSWYREKTIGVQDAGATAMYYLIESFIRHLTPRIEPKP